MSVRVKQAQRAGHLLEGGQGQPQEEDKLEGEVEGEPVDNADEALNDAAILLACGAVPDSKEAAYVKKAKTTQYYDAR